MSRKRHKTASVLATWSEEGGYELVAPKAKDRNYKTVGGKVNHSTWYPQYVDSFPTPTRQYWNHVNKALLDTLQDLVPGSGLGQRIGNKIHVEKVDFKVNFHLGHYSEVLTVTNATNAVFDPFQVRCVLLLDTQASLGDPDLESETPFIRVNTGYYNPEIAMQTYIQSNNTRYRILADEVKEATDHSVRTTGLPSFTNVSGTGTMTNSVLVQRNHGNLDFHFRHQFAEPLTMTFGDTYPIDHRFVLLFTVNKHYGTVYYSAAINTTSMARLYYTDA